jgi:hypothetical protein
VKETVAGNAGIIDQHFNGSEFGFDFGEACSASLIARYVPFKSGNAGFLGKSLGCLVIARIIGGDFIACCFQCF